MQLSGTICVFWWLVSRTPTCLLMYFKRVKGFISFMYSAYGCKLGISYLYLFRLFVLQTVWPATRCNQCTTLPAWRMLRFTRKPFSRCRLIFQMLVYWAATQQHMNTKTSLHICVCNQVVCSTWVVCSLLAYWVGQIAWTGIMKCQNEMFEVVLAQLAVQGALLTSVSGCHRGKIICMDRGIYQLLHKRNGPPCILLAALIIIRGPVMCTHTGVPFFWRPIRPKIRLNFSRAMM